MASEGGVGKHNQLFSPYRWKHHEHSAPTTFIPMLPDFSNSSSSVCQVMHHLNLIISIRATYWMKKDWLPPLVLKPFTCNTSSSRNGWKSGNLAVYFHFPEGRGGFWTFPKCFLGSEAKRSFQQDFVVECRNICRKLYLGFGNIRTELVWSLAPLYLLG